MELIVVGVMAMIMLWLWLELKYWWTVAGSVVWCETGDPVVVEAVVIWHGNIPINHISR